MKNGFILLGTMFCILFTQEAFSQGDTREIRKEVQMEMLNDEITLTIKTVDGEKITEEVFKGEEAQKMLAELEKVDEEKIVSRQEMKEEINVEEVEGVTKVTIRRTENGTTTEEVFFGADAENKIHELEMRENAPIKINMEE